MKLIKIYANNKPFHAIRFNPGFNVILGKPKEKKDKTKDTHNLGKSLLIDLIDFLMLKRVSNHLFSKHKLIFIGYTFFLEIKLNSGKFLIIKRGIEKQTKISFKLNPSELDGFEENLQWDHENQPLDKAREILNKYLSLDVVTQWGYRKSISYFLRTQNDFADVFQLAKYNKGKHRDWKPLLFNMLGFDGKIVLEKYEIEEKKRELEDFISQVKVKFALDGEEGDKIRGILDLKTEEKKKIETKIDDFNFYLQDKEINQKLVDEIESKISTMNTIRYNITEEIRKIDDSLQVDVPQIDIDELKNLYSEVEIYFPDNLAKEYMELALFNSQVTEERKQYMNERLQVLKAELEPTEKELLNLENMKSEMLSVLKDKDSYWKFKHYQKSFAKTEAEIARMEEKLENLGKLGELGIRITKLNDDINAQIGKIKELINRSNDVYKEIRRRFNHIIQEVLNVPAIISISINKHGNIEFNSDIQNPDNMEITAEGYGTTYKKLLCMAFDLSVLLTFNKRSFYRFVYHDGALESLDDRKKINFLNMVRDMCGKFDLQYILTAIDSDIPHDESDKKLPFPDNEVVLTLHDRDDFGRLFKISF